MSSVPQDVDAVVEVLAEAPRRHLGLQVPVGGADDADVGAERLGAAHPGDHAVLKHPQELDLELRRGLADLIEQQRAALGRLEVALGATVGAREGPLLAAEERRLEEWPGERSAVERQEGLAGTVAAGVHRSRHQLLAGARLAAEEHGGDDPGGPLDEAVDRLHALAGADDLRRALGAGEVGALGDDAEELSRHQHDTPEAEAGSLLDVLGLVELEVHRKRSPLLDEQPVGLGHPVALHHAGEDLGHLPPDEHLSCDA
jgi:hypothetical protein